MTNDRTCRTTSITKNQTVDPAPCCGSKYARNLAFRERNLAQGLCPVCARKLLANKLVLAYRCLRSVQGSKWVLLKKLEWLSLQTRAFILIAPPHFVCRRCTS